MVAYTSQLLVDGNNLLFKARERLFVSAAGRGQVCTVLGLWSKRTGIPVRVVFDGQPPTPGVEKQYETSGIEIQFSRSRSADLVIEDLIEAHRTPALLRVVSSDKAILSAARRRRCQCISSEAFAEELMDHLREPDQSLDSTPAHPALNDDEVDQWLVEFNMDPDVPPLDDTDLMGPVEPLD